MKAKIKMTIEVEGDVTFAQFKEWVDYQFGIRADISLSNPMHATELRDADIPPYHIEFQNN